MGIPMDIVTPTTDIPMDIPVIVTLTTTIPTDIPVIVTLITTIPTKVNTIPIRRKYMDRDRITKVTETVFTEIPTNSNDPILEKEKT